MAKQNVFFSSLAMGGNALGKGLIAGLAGTIAITISQMIEMKITKRENSNVPVTVGGKTLGVEPRGKAEKEKVEAATGSEDSLKKAVEKLKRNEQKFGQIMHYSYGSGWGVARGALDIAGVHGIPASLIHFGAIWGTAIVLIPAATKSPPVTQWSFEQIAIDKIHHLIYALAAGVVYEAMRKAEKEKVKKRNILF